MNNGSPGTQAGGGAGGDISLPSPFTSEQFLVMSGADGGDFGQPGSGNDFPDDNWPLSTPSNYGTGFENVSADYAFRFDGGQAGSIVTGPTYWSTREDDINNSTGTFEGE